MRYKMPVAALQSPSELRAHYKNMKNLTGDVARRYDGLTELSQFLEDCQLDNIDVVHAVRLARGEVNPIGVAHDEMPRALAMDRLAMDRAKVREMADIIRRRNRSYAVRVTAADRMLAKSVGITIAQDALLGELLELMDRVANADMDYPSANRYGQPGPLQHRVEEDEWSDEAREAAAEARGAKKPERLGYKSNSRNPARMSHGNVQKYYGGEEHRRNVQEDNEGHIDEIWEHGHGGEKPVGRPDRQDWRTEDHAKDAPPTYRGMPKSPPTFAERYADDHRAKARHGGRAIDSNRFSVLTDQHEPAEYFRPITEDAQRAALGILSDKQLLAADGKVSKAKANAPLFDGVICVTARPMDESALPKVSTTAAEEAEFKARYGLK